jgi:hypothetical protein
VTRLLRLADRFVMAMLSVLGLCRHAHTYRERRRLHGVYVMHFVCDRCGHAQPVVSRTAQEHRAATRVGQVRTRVTRPRKVVGIGRAR